MVRGTSASPRSLRAGSPVWVPGGGEVEVENATFLVRAQAAVAAQVSADLKGSEFQVVMGGLHGALPENGWDCSLTVAALL